MEWGLNRLSGKLYFVERVPVVWGEWSIVQATLNCLRLASAKGYQCDYLMLISGSCMPVKPIDILVNHLASTDIDHIEVVNAETTQWVTDGIQRERWEYYHFFNWRFQRFRFRAANKVQKLLRVKRKLPLGHTPRMGSQWWCLRTRTVDAILNLIDEHPELIQFYRRTWVPDELFFQTLVASLVPKNEIGMAPLTRYQFNSWGVPRVYYNDALPELLGESRFFARKISPDACFLKESLAEIGAMSEPEYRCYMKENFSEFSRRYKESLDLDFESRRGAWHSLAVSPNTADEYFMSIPVPIVVICSLNDLARKDAVASLKETSATAVYGDVLSPKPDAYNNGKEIVVGYHRAHPEVARHRWFFFLGDLAAQHPTCERLVLTMGAEAVEYLKVMRWSRNLSVILLDERSPSLVPECHDLSSMFRVSRSQRQEHEFNRRIQRLMQHRRCDYHLAKPGCHDRISEIVLARAAGC